MVGLPNIYIFNLTFWLNCYHYSPNQLPHHKNQLGKRHWIYPIQQSKFHDSVKRHYLSCGDQLNGGFTIYLLFQYYFLIKLLPLLTKLTAPPRESVKFWVSELQIQFRGAQIKSCLHSSTIVLFVLWWSFHCISPPPGVRALWAARVWRGGVRA